MAGFIVPLLIAFAGLCYGFVYARDDKLYKKPLFLVLCLAMATMSFLLIILYHVCLKLSENIDVLGTIVAFTWIFFLNIIMALIIYKLFILIRDRGKIFYAYSNKDLFRIGVFWASCACFAYTIWFLCGITRW